MATEDKKVDLFADLSDHYLLILAGVVSLTTFVPLFINAVTDIVGLECIRLAYYLFVFIYFIVPYALYYLHGNSKYLKDYENLFPQNRNLKGIAVWIMPVALIFMVIPIPYFDTVLFFCLLAAGMVYGYMACRNIGYGASYRKEARVVFVVLITATLFVLIPGFKTSWQYNYKSQDTAFNDYKSKDILNKYFARLMDNAMNESGKYRMQVVAKHPVPPVLKPEIDYCQLCNISIVLTELQQLDNDNYMPSDSLSKKCEKLRDDVRSVLKYDSQQLNSKENNASIRVYQIDASFIALGNYASYIQQKRMVVIDKHWADLLKSLQFNSVCWSFVLIILGVGRWYAMSERLRTGEFGIRYKLNIADRQENLDQLKSFILLSLILVLPWFRPIDASTVNLSRPFINFSLADLMHTGSGPVNYDVAEGVKPKADSTKAVNIIINNPAHITDTVKIIDSVKIITNSTVKLPDTNFYKWYSAYPIPYVRDTILDDMNKKLIKIDTNVLNNQKLIKRVISDPADRK